MSVGHILNSNNDKLNVNMLLPTILCYCYGTIHFVDFLMLQWQCACVSQMLFTMYFFFLLKQYHRWILMDVFVKKSQTHVDLLSVKQFQNLWHWCKNKAFTIHRSKREGLHFLSIKSPRYKANLFTPYQLATSAAKKRDKMPDIFCSLKLF